MNANRTLKLVQHSGQCSDDSRLGGVVFTPPVDPLGSVVPSSLGVSLTVGEGVVGGGVVEGGVVGGGVVSGGSEHEPVGQTLYR